MNCCETTVEAAADAAPVLTRSGEGKKATDKRRPCVASAARTAGFRSTREASGGTPRRKADQSPAEQTEREVGLMRSKLGSPAFTAM